MNNGKYHTSRFKELQREKTDRIFGPITDFSMVCERCGKTFMWKGRKYTKEFERKRFCSRSCSNNRQDWWNGNATQYRTIAFQRWKEECAVCGFDKIVAVHHLDENRLNNNPKNLIPLCPNHHSMVHSRWRKDIQPIIDKIVEEKFSGDW